MPSCCKSCSTSVQHTATYRRAWPCTCLRSRAATARSWQVTGVAASPRALPGVNVALPTDAGSLALPSLRLGCVALEVVGNNALCRLVHVFQRALILGLLGLAVLVLGRGRHRPIVGAALLLACALALEGRLGPGDSTSVKQRPENLREPCARSSRGRQLRRLQQQGLTQRLTCCAVARSKSATWAEGGPNLQRPPLLAAATAHLRPRRSAGSRARPWRGARAWALRTPWADAGWSALQLLKR